MRRAFVILVALLIGICAAAAASARGMVAGHENLEGQFAVGVSGGIVKPNGQIGNEPNWLANGGSSGLDLRYGWNGTAHAEFFMTSFLSTGLWYGRSDLRMRPEKYYSVSGPETYYMLVRGQTSMVGLHVTGYLPTQRSWTPYAFAGVARYFREVDFSQGILEIAPTTDVTEVTDDRVGFDGGVGFEQPLNRTIGLTAAARYFYSGPLQHDLLWMGHPLEVKSWEFWSVDVGLTWHAPPRPATR